MFSKGCLDYGKKMSSYNVYGYPPLVIYSSYFSWGDYQEEVKANKQIEL